jgi:hypothetical protein
MGISVIGAGSSSGGGGGGDFVINTGDYSSDTAELSTEFAAGAYGITVSPTDATLDIYLVASDGSFAGYTNTGSITATIPFDKVVVLGSTSNTSLSFVFNGESQTATTKGQLGGAGAVISSVVTSSLPSVNDTTVVNGGNFAADVEISFIDQSAVETAAKTVVRSSSTQLIVTRPDAFSPDDSPYTIKAVNPGVPVPSSTNPHLLSNSVTAGTNPVWTTSTTVVYNIGGATNHTFLATDTEATDIDYSIVSGTLPAGLALDGETGVLSGTASGTPSDGDVTAVTIRAIDAGGNFLDKAFDLTANEAPTWTTAASINYETTVGASLQLVASTGSTGGALTYTLQSGTLHAGTSLNSSGLISGTTSAAENDTATFTVRVTDEFSLFTDREFTQVVLGPFAASGGTVTTNGGYKYHSFTSSSTLSTSGTPASVEYLVVAGGGGRASGSGAGGGAGGMRDGTMTLSAGSYSITIGVGGNNDDNNASNGGDSVFNGITSTGGGKGGYMAYLPASGGSGGGGAVGAGGSGIAGQGFDGGDGDGGESGNYGAAGGGGAGAAGTAANGNDPGNGGSGRQWVNGTYYAGGGGGGSRVNGDKGSQGTSSGRGDGANANGTNANAGIVIIRYAV